MADQAELDGLDFAPEEIVVYRQIKGPEVTDADFESRAKRGKELRERTLLDVIGHYGVSVFTDLDKLVRERKTKFAAEIHIHPRAPFLSVKTLLDADHRDLIGDRGDMIALITHTHDTRKQK